MENNKGVRDADPGLYFVRSVCIPEILRGLIGQAFTHRLYGRGKILGLNKRGRFHVSFVHVSAGPGKRITIVPKLLLNGEITAIDLPGIVIDDIREKRDYWRGLGRHWEARFATSKDLWDLAKASRCWRRARDAEKAIEITDPDTVRNAGGSFKKDSPGLSAYFTSRGAALLDTVGKHWERLGDAEDCANKALRYEPTDKPTNKRPPHPYNLLGKIWYRRGNATKADECFAEAVRRGSRPRNKMKEMERAFEDAPLEIKSVIAEAALGMDRGCCWAKKYLEDVRSSR